MYKQNLIEEHDIVLGTCSPLCMYSQNAKLITKSTGCKGKYSYPIAQTTPDAMHTVKDAIVNIYDLITGKDDTMNCRQCELNLGGRFGITKSSLKKKIQRKSPGVPYSLSSSDIALADKRASLHRNTLGLSQARSSQSAVD